MPLGHVAAPVQPVVAPLDKGSIPLEAPEAFLSPGALPFLLAALPRYHILIMSDVMMHEVLEGFL